MQFEFATSNRIVFGSGSAKKLGEIVAPFGKRVMTILGGNPQRFAHTMTSIAKTGATIIPWQVRQEPTVNTVVEAIQTARESRCECVVAIGGGSVLDTGKVVAAMLTNEGNVTDYLEIIGKALPLQRPSVPLIAVPTTAGTGSEVTRNAVLGVPKYQVKVSMRSQFLLPSVALVDPELTLSLPPEISAYTALDALTQLIEPYVSTAANPLTDNFCIEGIKAAVRALPTIYENGDDLQARENMSFASLMGGLALANARLGAVHGFAGPLGGLYSAHHGALCGALLPYVMRANIRMLHKLYPESVTLGRYNEIARLLTCSREADAMDGVEWVLKICARMGLARLSKIGVCEKYFSEIASKAQNSNSMKGNPVAFSEVELEEILAHAM